MAKLLLTEEGLKKLKEELKLLKGVKRKEITQRLKKSLSYGDLKENYEYQEAKEEQALVESRIAELEEMLKNVEIVEENKGASGRSSDNIVQIGRKVTIRNITDNDESVQYAIVGTMEADPMNGKISNESPVGAAVLERKVGDIVKIQVPAGLFEFEILKVS